MINSAGAIIIPTMMVMNIAQTRIIKSRSTIAWMTCHILWKNAFIFILDI